MKKLILLIVVIIISACLYLYIFQNHRNIANETSSYETNAINLINEFFINPTDSETKYLNKTIEVTGNVTDIDLKNITIDKIVFCQFHENIETLTKSSQLIIKGRFIGYDDLLNQIKLDQCIIIKN